LKNENEWSSLSDLLSNLIVKYADTLDIDSLPNPHTYSEDTCSPYTPKESSNKMIAKDDIA
jgi:hypothetical protein